MTRSGGEITLVTGVAPETGATAAHRPEHGIRVWGREKLGS
ncbi:hypothetical protein [Streptosporangium roseum]|nr:hypothetical protein [Streptosporangium roseum]